jgi:hypothetical protein
MIVLEPPANSGTITCRIKFYSNPAQLKIIE